MVWTHSGFWPLLVKFRLMPTRTLSPGGTCTAVTLSMPPAAGGLARVTNESTATTTATIPRATATGCHGGKVHLALSNSSVMGTWAGSSGCDVLDFGGTGFFAEGAGITGPACGLGGAAWVGTEGFSGLSLGSSGIHHPI